MRASLLVLAGCLHGHPGADAWHAVATAHFEMWTDGDVATAKHTLETFEHARSVILGVLAPDFDSHRKTLVVAFAETGETVDYLPRNTAASTRVKTPLLAPIIVMASDARRINELMLAHELTHAVTREFMPRQPAWFSEGIASYFEGLSLEGSAVEVGLPSPNRVAWLRKRLSVEQTVKVDRDDRINPAFYATAWAIASYLINANRPVFDAYEAKLRNHDETWTEMPLPELQRAVDTWIARNQFTVQRYKLELRPWPATVRTLPVADVLAMEGVLAHDEGKLATARQLDPTNLIAELAGEKPTLEAARAVAAAHPDDWRAHLVVMLLSTGAERDAERERSCALLSPTDAPPQTLQCAHEPRQP